MHTYTAGALVRHFPINTDKSLKKKKTSDVRIFLQKLMLIFVI